MGCGVVALAIAAAALEATTSGSQVNRSARDGCESHRAES